MEAFTLLKYWRGGGALGLPPSADGPASRAATAILTAVDNETDDENEDFFDLELTVPEDSEESEENQNASPSEEQEEEEEEEGEEEGEEEEEEFKFTVSPSSEANSKPQFTASILKSATKFRVFMLGLKKAKGGDAEAHKEKKLFTVKLKVEEVPNPMVSLFGSSKGNKATQKHAEEPPPEDKQRFSKEVMQKYFKMVKPLYIRVSRRYAGKPPTAAAAAAATATATAAAAAAAAPQPSAQKLPPGLAVVCKHLGKSRSASSAAAPVSSKRRDDSLLQQQDGIQGAILHCKRSFNASRPECESSQLPRSVSHPSHTP